MIQSPKYNPFTDLVEHRPGLSINLHQAIETKTVMSTGVEIEHNEIHPDDVVGRVEDVFTAIDAQKSILRNGRTDSSLSPSSDPNSNPVSIDPPAQTE